MKEVNAELSNEYTGEAEAPLDIIAKIDTSFVWEATIYTRLVSSGEDITTSATGMNGDYTIAATKYSDGSEDDDDE